MRKSWLDYVVAQAEHTPSKEVCGLLLYDGGLGMEVMECPNAHPSPSEHFEVPPRAYLKAVGTHRLVGYYHSHSLEDENFSADDKECADEARLPLWVYSLKTGKFNLYRHASLLSPLIGRKFILGYHDCAQLVFDWYKLELGLEFKYFARSWSALEHGISKHADIFEPMGFTQVSAPYRTGDALVMSISRGTANHIGIMVDNCTMLHQMLGRTSSTTPFTREWDSSVVCAYRKV